jgi:DnaJ-class molecular chaperone
LTIVKIWRLNVDNFPLSGKWWEILGVEANAHPTIVKESYRRLARLYHPDINSSQNAQTYMQAINRAYLDFQEQYK